MRCRSAWGGRGGGTLFSLQVALGEHKARVGSSAGLAAATRHPGLRTTLCSSGQCLAGEGLLP